MIHIMISELNITEDKVYDMNYLSALNWLSYFNNRDEVMAKKNKEKYGS